MTTNHHKITFVPEKRKFEGIDVDQVKFWESCYPDVDVVDCLLKKMPAWLDGNPNRASKYKNWKRFIVGWLSRQQERYSSFGRKDNGIKGL